MSGIFFQVGIVFALCLLVLLLIMIKRKSPSIDRIIILCAVAGISFAGIYGGFFFKNDTVKATETKTDYEVTKYIAYTYAGNGNVEIAKKLLESIPSSGDDSERLLMEARLSALDNNYENADLLYKQYVSENPDDVARIEEEASLVSKLLNSRFSNSNNGYLAEYQTLIKEDETLPTEDTPIVLTDFSPVTTLSAKERNEVAEEYRELVCAKISADVAKVADPETISVIQRAAMYEQEITACLLENNGNVYVHLSEECKDAITALSNLAEKNEFLMEADVIRDAILAGNVLTDNASAIAGAVDYDSSAKELMAVLDLLVSRKISVSEIAGIAGIPDELVESVEKQLLAIVKDESQSDRNKNQASETVQILDSEKTRMINELIGLLVDKCNEEGIDISKVYMEAAKAYNAINAETNAEYYINEALNTYQDSDDETYVEAMDELASIITDEDGSDVSKTAIYAQEAINQINEIDVSGMSVSEKVIEEWGSDEGESTYLEDNGVTGSVILDIGTAEDFVSLEKETQEKTKQEASLPISEKVTNTVVKQRAIINIGKVSTADFPEVSAIVSFGENAGITESNIQSLVSLKDCARNIPDFYPEKVAVAKSKIILLCDMSGSMSGNLSQLKKAVKSFADGMGENESVKIAGFTESISLCSPFFTDKQKIYEYADKLTAFGGTGIMTSLTASMSEFGNDIDSNNIVILMTDGEDNYPMSDYDISKTLKSLCASKNATVYCVGLGSGASVNYLSTISKSGDGQLVYVNSGESLSSFYDFIHTQLANQYVLTFTALDTISNKRDLCVSIKDSNSRATKIYYRDVEDAQIGAPSAPNTETPGLFEAYGLSSAYLYKTDKPTRLNILGENFKPQYKYEITLKGKLRSYALEYEYKDETTISVLVPGDLPVDVYDLSVYVKEYDESIVEDALTIALPCNLKHFTYGAYDFTAEKITTSDNLVSLSGNVTMNGWLHFKGDVRIEGAYLDSTSEYVTLKSTGSSYIAYQEGTSQNAFTRWIAEKGWQIPVPSFSVRIYSEAYDSSDYSDFPVQKIPLEGIRLKDLAVFGAEVALYPDMIYSSVFHGEPDLAYLQKMLPQATKKMKSYEWSGGFVLTSNEVCVHASFEYNYDKDSDKDKQCQFFKMGLNLKKFKAVVDTATMNNSVEVEFGFNAFKIKNKAEVSSFGLKIGWKAKGLDSITISGGVKQKVSDTPIPIYLKKLSLGVSGMSELDASSTWQDYLKCKITGGFKLSTDSLAKRENAGDALFNGKAAKRILDFFDTDEITVAEIDDAKINICLGDFNINFSADAKFLGIKIGNVFVQIGKFDYSNALLGISEEVLGAEIKLGFGFDFDWEHLDLWLKGAVDLVVGHPVFGLTVEGDLGFDFRWFIFSLERDLYGTAGIGAYRNSYGNFQFTVAAEGRRNDGKLHGARLDWTSDGKWEKSKY